MTSAISSIIDNIYIGDYDTALNDKLIKKFKIDVIINCTKREKRTKKDVIYYQIPIEDPPNGQDLHYLLINYKRIYKFINKQVKKGKNIFIHCIRGSQRAPAIVALYLMLKYKICLQAAIMFIKKNRFIAFFGQVNYLRFLNFIDQLIDQNNNQTNNQISNQAISQSNSQTNSQDDSENNFNIEMNNLKDMAIVKNL